MDSLLLHSYDQFIYSACDGLATTLIVDDEALQRDGLRPCRLQTRHSGRLVSLVLKAIHVLIPQHKQILLLNSDFIPVCLIMALIHTNVLCHWLRAAASSVESTLAKRDGLKPFHGH